MRSCATALSSAERMASCRYACPAWHVQAYAVHSGSGTSVGWYLCLRVAVQRVGIVNAGRRDRVLDSSFTVDRLRSAKHAPFSYTKRAHTTDEHYYRIDVCSLSFTGHSPFGCCRQVIDAASGAGNASIQRAALQLLIHCVCAPTTGDILPSTSGGSSSRPPSLTENMWDCVRRANGIMVLRDLLFTKTPLSDADALRSLACQAMDGLARSTTVRQIVSKMPLIANNELHCKCAHF